MMAGLRNCEHDISQASRGSVASRRRLAVLRTGLQVNCLNAGPGRSRQRTERHAGLRTPRRVGHEPWLGAAPGAGARWNSSSSMPGNPGACVPTPAAAGAAERLAARERGHQRARRHGARPRATVSADTKQFAQKGLVVSTSLVHRPDRPGRFAAASLEQNFTEVTGCPISGDAACARGFLERFAERRSAGPVASAEIDDLMRCSRSAPERLPRPA